MTKGQKPYTLYLIHTAEETHSTRDYARCPVVGGEDVYVFNGIFLAASLVLRVEELERWEDRVELVFYVHGHKHELDYGTVEAAIRGADSMIGACTGHPVGIKVNGVEYFDEEQLHRAVWERV